MSTEQRKAMTKMREKYARAFGLDVAEVEAKPLDDDDAQVWAPGRELPTWTLGREVRT